MTKLKNQLSFLSLLMALLVLGLGCNKATDKDKDNSDPDETIIEPPYSTDEFVMGADLSYLNQILDKNGEYDGGKDPYQIFKDNGTNLVRLRLWNKPSWIREVYQNEDEKLYSSLDDVISACKRVDELEMDVCLDFHYSDNWADPGKQIAPEAWKNLELNDLIDSVYSYTFQSLSRIKDAGIIPAFIQVGNEINAGMIHPLGHFETNEWENLGLLLNSGIRAIRDLYDEAEQPRVIIHIAQPENVRWFFNNVSIAGGVSDFDIIGISYYPKWSSVSMTELEGFIRTARNDFQKDVMIMETAFPWTNHSVDRYSNIFSGEEAAEGYDISPQGQLNFMKDMCQKVIDGGGIGVVYWEPGWISSDMKTQWGQGSAWENCSFFNFNSNNSPLPVFDYQTFQYNFDK